MRFTCDGFAWIATLTWIKPGKPTERTPPSPHLQNTHTPFRLNWSDWLTDQTEVDPPVNWQIRPYLSMSDIHPPPTQHNSETHSTAPYTPRTHTHTQNRPTRTKCLLPAGYHNTPTHTPSSNHATFIPFHCTTHLAVIGTLAKISPHFPMQQSSIKYIIMQEIVFPRRRNASTLAVNSYVQRGQTIVPYCLCLS